MFDRFPPDLAANPYEINLRHIHIAVVTTEGGGIQFIITAHADMPARVDNVLYRAQVNRLFRTGSWFPYDPNNPIHRISFTSLEINGIRRGRERETLRFMFEFSEESEL
ncbi:hypothetical protein PtrM4_069630 [Pyrenophora tritici-repentis]|uniref:Uncharacterized protein n=1 Tax=Pyrenophora tritici-repentis TaxID=45151 RepID=A0A834S4I2_9PLEO|nr:hypothetical protein A1F99_033280 [Pyrenophora tritici-repentis]KAF7575339.1 hypothetical protein PtrM4_069630 [Pyrenophora tritici-repentis]KAI0588047.1 hypothetical protein Alg215_01159 [Pyrenophora tritici-repentis]KAI1514918.1 hypothetical protein Ptr86124_006241 [Pyrenophora tritici-repentis]KAI1672901.1 hypothetical protein L13192_03760 [Pyrenophora tritici-repentis]